VKDEGREAVKKKRSGEKEWERKRKEHGGWSRWGRTAYNRGTRLRKDPAT